jgi:hypothetical protein
MVNPEGMGPICSLIAFRAASAGMSTYNAAPAHAVRPIEQASIRQILEGSVQCSLKPLARH